MNYGMYVAASSLLVNEHRMDVAANNIANVNTPSFRPDIAGVKQRAPERVEDNVMIPAQEILEKLGGGVFASKMRMRDVQGALNKTNNPMDLAIDGDGYFMMSTGQGTESLTVRFTRDGRLAMSEDGDLVHGTSGMKMLGVNNRPIRLDDDAPVEIDKAGVVWQHGIRVAKLRIVTPPSPEAIHKTGKNSFQMDSQAMENMINVDPLIRQGHIEESAVQPMRELMAMQSASSAANRAVKFMQYHDGLMNAVINRVGRVG